MSPVETEKVRSKPVVPLGSFLGKLTPKPVAKPVEKPAEKIAEAKTEAKSVEVKSEPLSTDQQAVKVEAPANADQQTKTVAAPKETTPDAKADPLEKQLAAQATANLRLGKENAELKRALDVLQKQQERIEQKLDGTFEESTAPSPEQVKADADLTGRIKASHKAAIDLHGKQHVMENVWNIDSPYQQLQAANPRIRARVMESDAPVLEALLVLKEEALKKRYGETPDEWKANIEAELAPKLKQEILDGLKTKPGPATNTLGNVRGGTERTEQKNDAPNVLNLGQVFPWGAKRT